MIQLTGQMQQGMGVVGIRGSVVVVPDVVMEGIQQQPRLPHVFGSDMIGA